MVNFIDFYFHFLANFQTYTSPHTFTIFTHVMSRDSDSEPGLPVLKVVGSAKAVNVCLK